VKGRDDARYASLSRSLHAWPPCPLTLLPYISPLLFRSPSLSSCLSPSFSLSHPTRHLPPARPLSRPPCHHQRSAERPKRPWTRTLNT